jgi:hypothetical protein
MDLGRQGSQCCGHGFRKKYCPDYASLRQRKRQISETWSAFSICMVFLSGGHIRALIKQQGILSVSAAEWEQHEQL